jgi:uncharacterized DUF497 family protein
MQFEWDSKKAALNEKKHGVTFDEASSVFDDLSAQIVYDPDHSVSEHREIIIGTSRLQRVLFISFTERGNITRIISARIANKYERKNYEAQAPDKA